MEITVSLETYKALTQLLQHEQDSYDAVIWRAISQSNQEPTDKIEPPSPVMAQWLEDDIKLPLGTQLRRRYKGEEFLATIEQDGLLFNDELYDSLSSAAITITKEDVNGWAFWNYQNPKSGRWEPIGTLRRE